MRPFNLDHTYQKKTNKVNASIKSNPLQLPTFDFSKIDLNLPERFGCEIDASFNSPTIKESFGHISRFNIDENAENIDDRMQTTPVKKNKREYSESSDQNMRSI